METVSKKRGRPRIHDADELRWMKGAFPELCDRSVLEWTLAVAAQKAMGLNLKTGTYAPEFAWFTKANGTMRHSLIWALGRVKHPEVVRIFAREVVRLGKAGERTHPLVRRVRRWNDLYESAAAARIVQAEHDGTLAELDIETMVREIASRVIANGR